MGILLAGSVVAICCIWRAGDLLSLYLMKRRIQTYFEVRALLESSLLRGAYTLAAKQREQLLALEKGLPTPLVHVLSDQTHALIA